MQDLLHSWVLLQTPATFGKSRLKGIHNCFLSTTSHSKDPFTCMSLQWRECAPSTYSWFVVEVNATTTFKNNLEHLRTLCQQDQSHADNNFQQLMFVITSIWSLDVPRFLIQLDVALLCSGPRLPGVVHTPSRPSLSSCISGTVCEPSCGHHLFFHCRWCYVQSYCLAQWLLSKIKRRVTTCQRPNWWRDAQGLRIGKICTFFRKDDEFSFFKEMRSFL